MDTQTLPKSSIEDRATSGRSVDPSVLARIIAKCWSRETSYDPESWCPENPAWGQCAVTALVVQDFLGGSLVTADVSGFHHYFNRLPGDVTYDLTHHQFGDHAHISQLREADRNYVLSYLSTKRRYRRLKSLVSAELQAIRRVPNP